MHDLLWESAIVRLQDAFDGCVLITCSRQSLCSIHLLICILKWRCAFGAKDRVSAAKSLVAKLGASRCRGIIEETNRLCEAYVELANHNVDRFKGKNGGKLLRTQNIEFKNLRAVISFHYNKLSASLI